MNQLNSCQPMVKNENLFSGFCLSFFTLLVFLSPLVSVVDNAVVLSPLIFYPLLIISGVAATYPFRVHYLPALAILCIIIFFSISQSPAKAIGAGLVLYVAYRGVVNLELFTLRTFFVLLVINYLFAILQLSGTFDFVYSFSNYSNESLPTSFLVIDSVPAAYLPQIRPSGIFPSPTFISYFCIILFSFAIFYEKTINKWFMSLIGSFLMLTGSTLGLALILLLALIAFSEKAFVFAPLAYALTFFIYSSLFPAIAKYNFSWDDISSSVLYRPMHESILTVNPYLFVATLLVFLPVFLLASKRVMSSFGLEVRRLFSVFSIIFFPLILHDSSSSLLSAFIIGLGVGMVVSFRKRSAESCGRLRP